MSDSHERTAQDHGPALADEAVREQPAEERREIDEPGLEPVDLRGTHLRELQVLDHVVDQERPHPVVGKTVPHFGEEKDIEAPRMFKVCIHWC